MALTKDNVLTAGWNGYPFLSVQEALQGKLKELAEGLSAAGGVSSLTLGVDGSGGKSLVLTAVNKDGSVLTAKVGIDELVEDVNASLRSKADTTAVGGAKWLSANQWPRCTLYNVERLASGEEPPVNRMWYDWDNDKLMYRDGEGEDSVVGNRADCLYCCNDKIYRRAYNGAGFVLLFDPGWLEELGTLDVDADTGRIAHGQSPWVVLETIEGAPTTAAMEAATGNLYWYDPRYPDVLRCLLPGKRIVSVEPSRGVLYCDASTGKLYIWTAASGTAFNASTPRPWQEVGSADVDVSGKADLLDGTAMLSPSQWPHVNLKNVTTTVFDEIMGVGEVYFDSGRLYMHMSTEDIDLGAPSRHVVYMCGDKLYRWTGSAFTAVGGGLSAGDLKTVGGYSLVGEGDIPLPSGGEGGGTSVAVVDALPDEPDAGTAYFFSHSRLQGVGSYNTLLQEGKVTLADGSVHYYHPGNLYHVYPDGRFDIVEDTDEDNKIITFDNNIVYCHGQRTSMERYGSVYVSNTVKYAETASAAYFSIGVNGPFFARVTPVSVSYNSLLYSLYVRYNDDRSDDSGWIGIGSGETFNFTYDNFFEGLDFKLVRKGSAASRQVTEVTFDNGVKKATVKVVFSKGVVFFKDGAQVAKDDAGEYLFKPYVYSASKRKHDTAKPLSMNDDGTFTIPRTNSVAAALGFEVDLGKYNVVYAVVTRFDRDKNDETGKEGYVGWKNTRFTESVTDKHLGSTVCGDVNAHNPNPGRQLRVWGEAVMRGVVSNCRECGSYGFDLVLTADRGTCRVSEIGILSYEAPEL